MISQSLQKLLGIVVFEVSQIDVKWWTLQKANLDTAVRGMHCLRLLVLHSNEVGGQSQFVCYKVQKKAGTSEL